MIPFQKFSNKFFYNRKIYKKLVIELKFNAETIGNGIKLVWIHLNASKLIYLYEGFIFCLFVKS